MHSYFILRFENLLALIHFFLGRFLGTEHFKNTNTNIIRTLQNRFTIAMIYTTLFFRNVSDVKRDYPPTSYNCRILLTFNL